MITNAFKLVFTVACVSTAVAQAGTPEFVNGYTYVAPSYYLSPPVFALPPAVVIGTQPVVLAQPVSTPVAVPPAVFVNATVVPHDPVWPYAYFGAPAPYFRETVRTRPNEVEYKVKGYNSRGKQVYSYEAETRRNGAVVIRERVR